MKVLVVGGGFAGMGAAFAARRAGASVTLVQHTPGASALYAGVVDGDVSTDAAQAPLLRDLAAALGLRLGPTTIATREGVLRAATGADSALLDLTPLAGKRIGFVDVPRDDWDAPLLVRSFNDTEWARATTTHFELVPLDLLEKSHQRRVSAFDFATSFERPERPAWLAEVLKKHAGPDAWLFGPWLGIKRELGRELTAAVGVPVGEVTSPPGGPAGARFEIRRDALLRALEAELVVGRVVAVRPGATEIALSLEDGRQLAADALVVATGGFVSGAIELSGALSGVEPAGFELGIAGLPALQVKGELGRPVSSLFGVDLAARGRRLLEHVGLVVATDGGVAGAARAFAGGDVVGPVPPSVGHALTSGIRAGSAAASAR